MTDEQVLTAFFTACSIVCWLSIRALVRDRSVKGVSTIPTWVFLSTNAYEVFFFGEHEQWFAVLGAVGMTLANASWLTLFWWYRFAANVEAEIAFSLDSESYSC